MDKAIERMLQKQLNVDVPDFNNEAWEQMEHLLSREEQKKKRRFFVIWFFGGLIIMVGILAYFMGFLKEDKFSDREYAHPAMNPAFENNALKSSPVITKYLDNDLNKSGHGADQRPDNGLAEYPNTSIKDKQINTIRSGSASQNTMTANLNKRLSELNKTDNSDIPEERQDNTIEIVQDIAELDTTISGRSRTTLISSLVTLSKTKGFDLLKYDRTFNSPDYIIPAEKDRWSMTLGVGWRWASTHSFERYDGDYEYNFLLGYRLSNKITISTGLNYISEYYKAEKEDYHPPRGFWTRMIAPTTTSARCRMLEMPITLSYNFTENFSFSAGASSTFIWQEKYYYHYVETDTDLVKNWMANWQNNHLISHFIFSLDYKYKQFSIAPYMLLPRRGIGHGNIELRATGVRLYYHLF